jgi:hypothetical protein
LLAGLPDDLLADILIRLPTVADLGRASMVCVAFHRVISVHSFLHRLRPPPLLGITSVSFIPAAAPHPCATLARAFTPATPADFWCRFIPTPDRWSHCDFHVGRAHLAAVAEGSGGRPGECNPRALVREFAVCDPLHRRYLLLPTISEDLTALVNQSDVVRFSPFLAPSEEDEGGTPFRVIYLVQCQTKLVSFIFSSISGSWHAAEFDGWSALTAESSNPTPGFETVLDTKYYAHGRFCWAMSWSHKFLVLDMRTMEFSTVNTPLLQIDPPPPRAIVEEGEGKFGMFTPCVDMEYEEYELFYTVVHNGGKGTVRWQPKAVIPLRSKYHYNITGVTG